MAQDVIFNWNRPVSQIITDVTGGDKTLKFMAVTWHRLYDPWVPMDTGTLAHDAIEYSVESGKGVIRHKAPYAGRTYRGENMKFHKDKHPLAQAYWDEGAKQAGRAESLASETETFIKRGGWDR